MAKRPRNPRTIDPDAPDPRYGQVLGGYWSDAAKRLRTLVESPAGMGGSSEWTHARASSQYAQVVAEMERLKRGSAQITGQALTAAARRGRAGADKQLDIMGWQPPDAADILRPQFDLIDTRTIEVVARDTYRDLARAADATQQSMGRTLRAMADNGLKVSEVNDLIAQGVISGKTGEPIRRLRDRLREIHGERITILDRNGDERHFGAGYYAKMVIHTRTREASVIARHERLAEQGIDLVTIVGRVSNNFCTAYIDRVFSLSGKHPDYPPLASLVDGPPFHPNCSKSTAPFIEALEDPAVIAQAKMDADDPMLRIRDRNALQRAFEDLQGRQEATERHRRVLAAIGG